jgi:hypothetical protein
MRQACCSQPTTTASAPYDPPSSTGKSQMASGQTGPHRLMPTSSTVIDTERLAGIGPYLAIRNTIIP